MKEKRLENARICLKGDIEANWDKAIGFIPKDKEIIIYKVDDAHPIARLKVGDGKTAVQDLEFIGANINVNEIKGVLEDLVVDATKGFATEDWVTKQASVLAENLQEHTEEYVNNRVDAIVFPDVDQIYNAKSQNAQSGVAVSKALEPLQENKFDKAGGIISGDLSVQGNLEVKGTTTTKDTETVLVKDNVIVANSDGNELLEEAGFAVKTGADAAYGIMYDPNGDGVKIGLGTFDENGKFTYTEGEDQFLATRDDTIENNHTVIWDKEKKKLVDSGVDHGDYVKFMDIASNLKAGVVKVVQSKGVSLDGEFLKLETATEKTINEKDNKVYPLTSAFIDLITKVGLTTNTLTLTDEEKATVLEWLGAVGKGVYADNDIYGLVKTNANYGIQSDNGTLYINRAVESEIDAEQQWKPITPHNLKYAVMVGISGKKTVGGVTTYGNQAPLDEEGKASALKWLGAEDSFVAKYEGGTKNILYGAYWDGSQQFFNFDEAPSNITFPRRTITGGLRVKIDETDEKVNELAVPKKYVDDNCVARYTEGTSGNLYAYLCDGSKNCATTMIRLSDAAANGMGAKTIPIRDSLGGIQIQETPTEPLHAVPKKYVDDLVGNINTALEAILGV